MEKYSVKEFYFFSLTSPGAGPRRAGKLAASFSETFVNVQN